MVNIILSHSDGESDFFNTIQSCPGYLKSQNPTIHKWYCCSMKTNQRNIIIIYHECESGIEKSVPIITTIWHPEACRVMTNGDPEKQIFLSHPHTNNGFFFLLTI